MKVESSIVQALKKLDMPSDITVVLSDRDGLEPRAPYLLIQIISTSNVGTSRKSVSHEEDNVFEKVFQTKDFHVSLTFHASTGGDTHDWVQHFHTGLESDLLDWAFTQSGLGLVSLGDIMYQSQPIDGRNYKRAIIDTTLRAEVIDEYKVNPMNRVEFVGNIVDDLAGKTGEVVVDIPFGY